MPPAGAGSTEVAGLARVTPQSGQNFAPGGAVAPQSGHVTAKLPPQFTQNFAPVGLVA